MLKKKKIGKQTKKAWEWVINSILGSRGERAETRRGKPGGVDQSLTAGF